MPFGKNDKRETAVEDVAITRRVEDLGVETPDGPGEHGFSALYPGAAYNGTQVADTNGRIFIVIHGDGRGAHRINQFDSQSEAQRFVEELLTQGVDAEAVETYRASKFDFEVSFRPVVHFKTY